MIVDILEIKDRINELETLFPNVFNIESINSDLNNNPFSHYLVYLDNNKILGFINYYEIYDRVEIANFNVLDSYQNQGIGNKLIKKVIELSKDKVNITLEVRRDNDKIKEKKMWRNYSEKFEIKYKTKNNFKKSYKYRNNYSKDNIHIKNDTHY